MQPLPTADQLEEFLVDAFEEYDGVEEFPVIVQTAGGEVLGRVASFDLNETVVILELREE